MPQRKTMHHRNPTVKHYIRILRKKDIIEYRDSKKTGGYHLTEIARDKLK
jgi:hypothetical protein